MKRQAKNVYLKKKPEILSAYVIPPEEKETTERKFLQEVIFVNFARRITLRIIEAGIM